MAKFGQEVIIGMPINISDLAQRILAVRKAKGFTQTELGRLLGVSPSYLSQVESGKGKPSVEMLVGIPIAFPDIDSEWLLTGRGSMLKHSSVSPSPMIGEERPHYGPVVATMESARLAGEAQLMEDLGLGEVALLSRFGPKAGMWHILEAVQLYYPRQATIAEIHEEVTRSVSTMTTSDVAAGVALLLRYGLLLEEPGGSERYTLAQQMVKLKSGAPEDAHQHAKEAIRELIRGVLPVAESMPKLGSIVTSQISVNENVGRELIRGILDSTRQRFEEAERDPGPGDKEVLLVLGISLSDLHRPE